MRRIFLHFVFALIAIMASRDWCLAQTQVEIRGFSQKEAMLLLGNRVDLMTSRPASPSRADDMAFLLKLAMRKNGYPQAEVHWSLPQGGRSIRLDVEKGSTQRLGEIKILGVPQEEMREKVKTYFKPKPQLKALSDVEVAYIPERVESAIENATSYLHSQGYWLAKIEVDGKRYRPREGLVDLTFKVQLGPLYHLAPVSLQGVNAADAAAIQKRISNFVGKVANTENILAIQSEAVRFYTSNGYTFANHSLSRTLSENLLHLTLTLDVGQRYRIGKVHVEGLEKTKPSVMRRRANRIKGKYFDPKKMAKNRRKLISTGAFESVLVDTDPQPDGMIDITLRFKEGRARSFGAHIGAGSYEGGILGVSYQDSNFSGRLQNFSLSLEYSGLGLLGQASLTDPMFRGSDRSVSLRGFLLTHDFLGYKKFEAGIGVDLVWTLTDHYEIRFYGDMLFAEITGLGLPNELLGMQDYIVNRVGIDQTWDYRNDLLHPDKGFHGQLITEVGLVSGDRKISYSKMLIRMSYRQPIDSKQYVHFSGKAGVIRNDDPEGFPIDQRFFGGGLESVRSFPKREMVPTIGGDPIGGEGFWAASAEYNRMVAGPLWSNVFFDAGAISHRASGIVGADVKLAVGLGFWLDLPIGPVRLEYGYNLNRQAGEPAGALHFAIGINF